MTLKRKLFLSAMLVGMTPLAAVSFFHHTRLSSMQTNVETVFRHSASVFENIAQSNRENMQLYHCLSLGIDKISENFAVLEQETRSLLENEILVLNREIETQLEMQGKMTADRIEEFIRSSIGSRMQADLLRFRRNEQNKEFHKFLASFPDAQKIPHEEIVKFFPSDEKLILPFFEDYIDESLIRAVEEMGYRVAIYLEGSVRASAFKDEKGAFLPLPHAGNMEIRTGWEKIGDRHYFLTYRELKDMAGFEIGRIIVALDVQAFTEAKQKRESGLADMKKDFARLVAEQKKMKQETGETDARLSGRFAAMEEAITQNLFSLRGTRDDLSRNAEHAFRISLLVLLTTLAGIWGFSARVSSSLTRSLYRLISSLREFSAEILMISGQLMHSGQTLAQGASEQAVAAEQISSSLEEIHSMTLQNADNTARAGSLMKTVREFIEKANSSAKEQMEYMNEISRSGEETRNIVKAISEIAFQIGLLSLNASTEAARAGKAGAGFAVVAGEVRNLAMKTAAAAENTSVLIRDMVNRIRNGAEIAGRTRDDFARISEISSETEALVREIAVASREQAEGIGLINKGAVDMDRVMQDNSVYAEETSSISERLSVQAKKMQDAVNYMEGLVHGK